MLRRMLDSCTYQSYGSRNSVTDIVTVHKSLLRYQQCASTNRRFSSTIVSNAKFGSQWPAKDLESYSGLSCSSPILITSSQPENNKVEEAQYSSKGKEPLNKAKVASTKTDTGTKEEKNQETDKENFDPVTNQRSKDVFARYEPQYMTMPLPGHLASINSNEEFFSYRDYPLNGQIPNVIYIQNEKVLDAMLTKLKGPVLGFDLEWKISTSLNVAVMQISDASTILLIHISKTHFTTSFPSALRGLIENPNILKVGVSIMGADMSRLWKIWGIRAKGVCELSYFARLIDRDHWGQKHTLISLTNLCKHYIGVPLRKGPVRVSDWTQTLSSLQREYAANDVYSALLIFRELERKRQTIAAFNGVWPPVSEYRENSKAKLLQITDTEMNIHGTRTGSEPAEKA